MFWVCRRSQRVSSLLLCRLLSDRGGQRCWKCHSSSLNHVTAYICSYIGPLQTHDNASLEPPVANLSADARPSETYGEVLWLSFAYTDGGDGAVKESPNADDQLSA